MMYEYWDKRREGVDSCFPLFVAAVHWLVKWTPLVDDKGLELILMLIDHVKEEKFHMLITTKPNGWEAKYNDSFVKMMKRDCAAKPDESFFDVFQDFWVNIRFTSAATLTFTQAFEIEVPRNLIYEIEKHETLKDNHAALSNQKMNWR